MSSTMKMSLLALVSTVAAVPHYGAHSQYHHPKPSGGDSYPQVPQGTGAPYPTGGWSGYNSTVVPYPTGSGNDAYPSGDAYPTGAANEPHPTEAGENGYGGKITTTIDVTSTSTQTIYSTVTVRPSAPAGGDKEPTEVENKDVPSGNGQCGPATVTVTAHEQVTVTVTPGGGYDASPAPEAPEAPATPVEQKTTEYAAAPPAAPTSQQEYATPSVIQKPYESSAAPSPAPSSGSGNGYSGGKRGLAYNDASLCKSLGGKFGWGYNWGQVENNDIGTKFIPTMHGPSKSSAEEWLANVDKAVQKGSNAVMGFNECDHDSQCNLSPEAACAAWKEYMNPIKSAHPDVTIIGPSVTNGETSKGMGVEGWLAPFVKACPDAAIDATNIHFYDIYDDTTIDRFKANVEKAAELTGKPIWITEFGLNPGSASQEQAETFLKEAMAYCDSSDKVQGYSWFMVGDGEHQLNSGNGPSAMGQIYAGAN